MTTQRQKINAMRRDRDVELPAVQPIDSIEFVPMNTDHGPGVGVVFVNEGHQSPAFLLRDQDWPSLGGQLIGAGTLVEVLAEAGQPVVPEPEPIARGQCSSCGTAIFGNRLELGICGGCA